MNADCGIHLEVIWLDEELIEVLFTCSNEYFGGSAAIALSHDALPNLVETLRGFPTGGDDTRQCELGRFNPGDANSGVRMSFYCLDANGHAMVEVKLRGHYCQAPGDAESVALRIAIEPAGVDAFLAGLTAMPISLGTHAALPMKK